MEAYRNSDLQKITEGDAPLEKTITRSEIGQMRLKGKPKCPACGNALSFVYEGSTGFSSVKCKRCNRESLINTETLEAILIEKAG